MDCKHQWTDVRTTANPNQYLCAFCGVTSDGKPLSFKLGPTLGELADKQTSATIAAFASGLKAHLRASVRGLATVLEHDEGVYAAIVWPALDTAIDAFAAEFQRTK